MQPALWLLTTFLFVVYLKPTILSRMQSYMYVRPSFLHLGDIQLEARWEYNFDAADEPRFHYYAVSYLEC